MAPSRSAGALALLLAVALGVGLVTLRLAAPPAPLPRGAAPELFSAERALDELAFLLGDGRPHPAGTEAHDALRARLVERLRALGLEVLVQERLAEGRPGKLALCRNVLARRRASRPREDGAIALVAHYDSVGASPGAGDDGSGVAALLEIARALSGLELRHDLVLVLTDAEEVGLIGARAFLEHPWARELGVALNLEARGTHGPSLMFETSEESGWLVEALARSSPRPRTTSLAELVYKTLPNDTDFSVLREGGVPGMNFAFIGGLSRYHGPRDELARLSPASVQHQGEQALALVRELDRLDLGRAPRVELAWTDLAGRVVLRWRRSAGPWLALLAPLAAALACARAREPLARLVQAFAATALAAAGALVGGALPLWVAARLKGLPDPAVAQPSWAWVALAGGSLAGAWLLGGLLAARAGARALVLAHALAASAVALIVALELPEVLPLVLPSAWAASAGALGLGPRDAPAWRASAAAALTLGVTTLLVLPLLEALGHSFGFALPFALSLAVAGAPLSVLLLVGLAALGARSSARAALAPALLALVATLMAWRVPAHDAASPARLNLRFVQDDTRGSSRWDVSTYGLEPPVAWREKGLRPAEGPPFPWLHFDRSLFVAPAPRWEVPAPALEVLGRERAGERLVVRARLSSPRGATRLHLHRPPGVQLSAVHWRGERIALRPSLDASTIFLAIPPEEGVEVELAVEPSAARPIELWMLDQDWALPPQAREWILSRPPDRTPFSDGDVSILGRRHVLE